MTQVLCVGLMVADILIGPVDPDIFEQDSIRLGRLLYAAGGDSLNVALNLAALGVPTALCGVVGDDPAGAFLVETVRKHGVRAEAVWRNSQAPTSTSIVFIESNGQRHFAYHGQANDALSPDRIPPEWLQWAGHVHYGSAMELKGMDGDGVAALFRQARAMGKTTSMDVTTDHDGLWLPKIEAALPNTDVFFPSYDEAVKITGETDLPAMGRRVRALGPKVFGVKLGAQGCYVTDFSNEHHVPALTAEGVVDTTGAGDAFMAGFLAGYCGGLGIQEAAVLGSKAASYCVRHYGASTHVETMRKDRLWG